MQEFQNIKRLIQNNELKIAIDLIMRLVNDIGYDKYISEAILYSARYNQNEKSHLGGILDDRTHLRERAKITMWMSEFLNRIEEELNDPFYQEYIFRDGKFNSLDEFLQIMKNQLTNMGNNQSQKQKILFLSANPKNSTRLQLDKEYRIVSERMRKNEYYELLKPELALTIENLIISMNQKPQIVHFSGHGEGNAIMISDDRNLELEMSTRALKRLFRQHSEDIKLVILNACYSAEQAEIISKLGMYVIGMRDAADDAGAIDFASGLYIGLSEGKSVEKAFDDAMIVIETKHPSFADLPEVWKDGKLLDL